MIRTIVRKLSAIFLWSFSIVFALVMLDLHYHFLSISLKNMLARYPYQWDFELMFVVLFLVWGVFLWIAKKNEFFIRFTAFAFITQGIVMIVLGFLRAGEMAHLFTDSIWWWGLGIALFISIRKY